METITQTKILVCPVQKFPHVPNLKITVVGALYSHNNNNNNNNNIKRLTT
jgi:hypothetical protein